MLRWDSWIDFGHLFSRPHLLLLPFSLHQSQTFLDIFFFNYLSPLRLSVPLPVSSPPLFPLYLPCDHLPPSSPPYPSISLSRHLFLAKIRAAFTSCFLLPIFPSLPLWHSKIYLCALHFLTSLTPNWLISFCRAVSLHLWKPNEFKILIFYIFIFYFHNFDKKPIRQLNKDIFNHSLFCYWFFDA